jgi:hypothetical protein
MASFLQGYVKQNSSLMKNVINNFRYKLASLFLCMIAGTVVFAQDASSSSNTTTSNTSTTVTTPDVPANWYMNPWVWVAGGVVLIIILFAIFRGGGKTKREVTRTVTTTTEINSD